MQLLVGRFYLPPVPGAHPASCRLELAGDDLIQLRAAIAERLAERQPQTGNPRGYVVPDNNVRLLLPRRAPSSPTEFLMACDLLLEFAGERYLRTPMGVVEVPGRLAIGIARIVGVQHGETVDIVMLVHRPEREAVAQRMGGS